MRGLVEIIQVAFDSTIGWEGLTEKSNKFLDGSAESWGVLALVALQNSERLVDLHDFLDELVGVGVSNMLLDPIVGDQAVILLVVVDNGVLNSVFCSRSGRHAGWLTVTLLPQRTLHRLVDLLPDLIFIEGDLLGEALDDEPTEELHDFHLNTVVV